MKRVLLIFFLVGILPQGVFSQNTAKYTYKPFKSEGCSVEYSVVKKDTLYYLIVIVESDRLRFLSNPVVKLKNMSGTIITLQGIAIGDENKHAGVVSGNYVIPITSISTTAQFPVREETFNLFKEGIQKVRLTMSPINHEREFKKDKIGRKLYEMYIHCKEQSEDF